MNEALVAEIFPECESFRPASSDRSGRRTLSVEIVGVVGSSRHDSLAVAPKPEYYLPLEQEPRRDHATRPSHLGGKSLRAPGVAAAPDPGDGSRCLRAGAGPAEENDRWDAGATAFQHDVVRRLCRARDAAGGDRDLRRDCLQRRATDARNRDPDGARRAAGRRPENDPAPKHDYRRDRAQRSGCSGPLP